MLTRIIPPELFDLLFSEVGLVIGALYVAGFFLLVVFMTLVSYAIGAFLQKRRRQKTRLSPLPRIRTEVQFGDARPERGRRAEDAARRTP